MFSTGERCQGNSLNKNTWQYCLLSHTWSLMIWTGSLVLISEVAVGHFVLRFMSSKMEIALFHPYLLPPPHSLSSKQYKTIIFLRSKTHTWNTTVHLLTVILYPPPPAYKKTSLWMYVVTHFGFQFCGLPCSTGSRGSYIRPTGEAGKTHTNQPPKCNPPKNLSHRSLKKTLEKSDEWGRIYC